MCQSLFFNKVVGACNFFKNETLAQVFSCEYCEISKNIFFTEHLWTTASINKKYEELLKGENIKIISTVGKQGELLKKFK